MSIENNDSVDTKDTVNNVDSDSIRDSLEEETVEKGACDKTTDENASENKGLDEVTDENADASSEDCEPQFKIKTLENKLKEQEDAFMRINAEYANYRRRTAEEKLSIGLFANEKIMNEMIPVIDNMERALESFEDKNSGMYTGVELVYKQLLDVLNKGGLEIISSEIGEDFDPNFHMAVLQEESSEFDAGKILLSMQKGYKLGNKVLRPSMVKVSC